jgi:hypothetical protein
VEGFVIKKAGVSLGYGFVAFEDVNGANAALAHKTINLQGHVVTLSKARPNTRRSNYPMPSIPSIQSSFDLSQPQTKSAQIPHASDDENSPEPNPRASGLPQPTPLTFVPKPQAMHVSAASRTPTPQLPIKVLSGPVDSGCTPCHLTPDAEPLQQVKKSVKFNLGLADGSSIRSSGLEGSFVGIDSSGRRNQINDIKVVDGLSTTLFSTYAFLRSGQDVWFSADDMSVNVGSLDKRSTHRIDATGSERNGLFYLDLAYPSVMLARGYPYKQDWHLWHRRLMHVGSQTMRGSLPKVRGFHVNGRIPPDDQCVCAPCIIGKMHRRFHPPTTRPKEDAASPKLAEVSLDILVVPTPSFGGATYLLGLSVNSAKGAKICYPCRTKSEVVTHLKFAKQYLERITNECIGCWKMDQAGENSKSREMRSWCLEAGIVILETGTEEHQSNSEIEGYWRTLCDQVRSHLADTNQDQRLWAEMMCMATEIYNSLVHAGYTKSPFEALLGTPPSLHKFKVFGCLAYAFILPKNRPKGKLSPRATPGIFIGFGSYFGHPQQRYESYKIMTKPSDPSSIVYSRDVYFVEDRFSLDDQPSFSNSAGEDRYRRLLESQAEPEDDDEDESREVDVGNEGNADEVRASSENSGQDGSESGSVYADADEGSDDAGGDVDDGETDEGEDGGAGDVDNGSEAGNEPDEIGAQKNGIGDAERQQGEQDEPPRRTQQRKIYQRVERATRRNTYIPGNGFNNYPEHHRQFSNVAPGHVLLTYPGPPARVAINDPDWRQAMKKENDQMIEMGVFELVPLPAGKKALDYLWVLTTKVDEVTGSEQKKARWVVNGSRQIQGEDYDKSYAETPSMESFLTLLGVRTDRGYETVHIDWKAAHLNPMQDFEVYVKQPKGFEEPKKEDYVGKLIHAVYGEKLAGYLWSQMRDACLMDECGFERCPFEPCTFVKRFGSKTIICDVHADDAPFFYDPELTNEMNAILEKISSRFQIKIERPLSKHLGLRIEYGPGWTTVDQEAYLQTVLNMYQENPRSQYRTPWDPDADDEFDSESESTEEDVTFMSRKDYAGLVGKLRYLTYTRPDISYGAGKLARKLMKPKRVHWEAGQCMLGYLRGTSGFKLRFKKDEGIEPKIVTNDPLELGCYSDADWAGDKATRRSTSGVAVIVCGGAVYVKSKRQPVVADSTVAAEVIALHTLIKEVMWIRNFLSWIGYEFKGPTILWCDNMGAIRNCEEGADRHKTKHMDIKYMFIRDVI